MLKQFPITELVRAVKDRVETGTKLKCYDAVKKNTPSPFTYIQVLGAKPEDTKTMFCKRYSVALHIIAEETQSSVPILGYIEKVEEALTEDITIPDGYCLVMQTNEGLQTIFTEETGEKHAVLNFSFKISYGYKVKI